MGRSSPSPVLLCGVKHVENKADTLAQGNKADHDRQHNGEQTNDLVEDAAEHITGYDGAKSGTGFSLKTFSFHKVIGLCIVRWLRETESNYYLRIQSPVCCHYTIPRYSLRKKF